MNRNINILSVIFLTAIYAFALGYASQSFAHSYNKDYSSSSEEKFITDLSSKLFCHTSQFDGSVIQFNNLPSSFLKKSFGTIWIHSQAKEQIFESVFAQYKNASLNFLVQHRKKDIIFPFHYFW